MNFTRRSGGRPSETMMRWNLVRLGFFIILVTAVMTTVRLYTLVGWNEPAADTLWVARELREAHLYIETVLASTAVLTAGCGLLTRCMAESEKP